MHFFYVGYDDVSDENLLLNHQDSVSETQVQVEKQRTLKRGRPSGKYNNHSIFFFFLGLHPWHMEVSSQARG